jgi:hypothetical protein
MVAADRTGHHMSVNIRTLAEAVQFNYAITLNSSEPHVKLPGKLLSNLPLRRPSSTYLTRRYGSNRSNVGSIPEHMATVFTMA